MSYLLSQKPIDPRASNDFEGAVDDGDPYNTNVSEKLLDQFVDIVVTQPEPDSRTNEKGGKEVGNIGLDNAWIDEPSSRNEYDPFVGREFEPSVGQEIDELIYQDPDEGMVEQHDDSVDQGIIDKDDSEDVVMRAVHLTPTRDSLWDCFQTMLFAFFYTIHKIVRHLLAEYLDVAWDDSAKNKVRGLTATNDVAVLAAVTE
ncbi:MAG: hypothetical protein Q9226_007071 [Calogaya cf. arnoldii]